MEKTLVVGGLKRFEFEEPYALIILNKSIFVTLDVKWQKMPKRRDNLAKKDIIESIEKT